MEQINIKTIKCRLSLFPAGNLSNMKFHTTHTNQYSIKNISCMKNKLYLIISVLLSSSLINQAQTSFFNPFRNDQFASRSNSAFLLV